MNNVSAENNFLNILSGKTYTSGGVNLGSEAIISENEFIGNQALSQYYFNGKYYGIIRTSDNSITKIRIWDGLKNPGIDNFDKEIIIKNQSGVTNSKYITGYYSWQGDAFPFHILGYNNQKLYVYITGTHLDSCGSRNRFFLVYSVDTNTGLLTKEYHHGGTSTEDWSCYIPSYEKIGNDGKIKINCSRGNTCGGGTEIRKVFNYDFNSNKIDFSSSTDFVSSTINNQNNVFYNIKPFGLTPSNLFNDKKYGIFGGTINTPYYGYSTGYNKQYCSRQIVIGELNNSTGLYDFYKYVDDSIKYDNYTNYNSTFINNGYLYYIKTTGINSSSWSCYGGSKTHIKRKIDNGTYLDIPGYNGGSIENVKELIVDFDFSNYFLNANAFKINYGVNSSNNTKLFIYSYLKGDYVEIKSGELFEGGDKSITIYNKLDFISSTDKKLSIKIVNLEQNTISHISAEALLDDTIITNNYIKLIDYEFENIFADGIYSLEPLPKQSFQIYNYKNNEYDSYTNIVDINISDYINQGTVKIKGNDITGLLIKFLGKVPGCYKNNIKIGSDIFSGCNSFTNYDGVYNNNQNIIFENDTNFNIYGGLYKKGNTNICPIGYSLPDLNQLEKLSISNNLPKGGYYNGFSYNNKDIKGYYLSKEGKVFSFDGNGFEILEIGNNFMYSVRCVKDNLNQSIFSYSNKEENNSNQFPWENIPSGDVENNTFMDYLSYVNSLNSNNEINTKEVIGDPVNLNTGEFIYDNTIMQYKSKGIDFNFNLTYKNQAYYNGPLGNNFDFGYNLFLKEDNEGNIYYHNGKLGVFKFEKNENGFNKNKLLKAELKLVDGKYNIIFNNLENYTFNEKLKIESIKDKNLNTINFLYDTNNSLIKIIDTLNREYDIYYNSDLRINKITDFTGNEVEFIYFNENETTGSQFDLKTIKMINGNSEKEISFTYTIGSDFESSHDIIKLIDSENNTYVENTYDLNDRVSSQKYGNASINYTYTTDTDGNITQNSVIDREGNNVIYTYDLNGNTIKKVVVKATGNSVYNYEYNSDNYIIKEILPLGNGFTYSYDTNNNLIEKRQKQDVNAVDSTDDIVTSYTYDLAFNKPTQIITPSGAIINLTLDIAGNITRKEILGVSDIYLISQTIVETYEYNNAGELIKKTDANGNTTSFEYINGNLVKSTKGAFLNTIETNYNYDSKGNIISITDGEGNITNLSYDDFYLLNKLTTPEGIESEYSYNKLNKKVNESIILGDLQEVSTSYEYDILDNPIKITKDIDNTRQKIIVTSYDNNSNITEITNGNNATVKFTYNEEGYIISKSVINGTQNITTSYIYDENNRLIKQINPNLSEINFAYDLFDRITKQTLSNGVYTTLSYDKAGNILETKTYSSTGILLQKESNTFDKLNRKISNTKYGLEDNLEITNKTYYDNVGNIVKIVDSNLGTAIFTYDNFNRLSQITDKLGNKIKNTYNKNDKIISRTITATDGKTITTNHTYDSDNRLISETNNLNQRVNYTYNNLNQVISKTDKDGVVTNYKYNYVGNLLEETILEKTTKYEYDINGNRTKVIDANNNITTYVYDSLNRLIKQIYPDGSILTQEYDISGNLIKRTDPNGTIVINNYDNLNRLTSRNIQTGTGVVGVTSEIYTYDELGRLTSGTDNLGNDVSFNFDSLNRLINETNSNQTINYTYDNNGNILSINNTNYAYGIQNRLLSVKNGTQNIADYTYNSLTQTKQTLGNGVTINYSYDELLRLSSLGNYDYTYNTTGNIISDGFDNYTYDELGQITGVNYDQVNIPEYNGDKIERFFYDNAGNRTSQENYTLKEIQSETCSDETVVEDVTLPNGKTKTVERKQRVCETATTQTEKQKNTLDYNTNQLNQYTKLQNLNKNGEVKKEFTYEYDNNGNLIKDDINQYFYDYKNRLVKVIQNEVVKLDENGDMIENIPEETIVEFTYDILGRRIQKQTQEKTINYIYADQNAIKEITTNNETNQIIETRENIYSNNLDDILSVIITDEINNTTEQYFYEKNHLGSITKITETNGAIVEQYEYDVFGVAYASVNNVEAVTTAQDKKTLNIKKADGSETANDGNSDELTIDNIRYKRYNGVGKIGNTRLYTGREYDAELKLYYNRARYYSPNLGRFISRDPIDVADDVNLYAYVGNNGVNYTDTRGTVKKLVGNEDSVRIIYNPSGVGHTSIQIGGNIFTYAAKGNIVTQKIRGIGSLGNPEYFDAVIINDNIEDILLKNVDYEMYDIKISDIQREKLNNFITKAENGENSYGVLGVNCTAFVQRALFEAGIVKEFNPDIGSNIPSLYNAYLNELSKGNNNYIISKIDFNYNDYNSIEKENIKNIITENYGTDRNLLDSIDNIYNAPLYEKIINTF